MRKRFLQYLILAAASVSFSCTTHASGLNIHILDVGEGDAILIETDGVEKKWALIDSGNLISGHKVARYLREKGVSRLDYLILTHPDMDHVGGVFTIAQTFRVDRILDNGEDLSGWSKTSDFFRWYVDLARKNRKYGVMRAGDSIKLNDVILKALWPPPEYQASSFNANSLVIMVEHGKFRILLAGDLIASSEKELAAGRPGLKAGALKVGHHGAFDASGEAFLKLVAPKAAFISVNKNNIRGYPSPVTLERLKNLGVAVYRTDQNGDIVLRASTNGEFSVATQRE